MSNKGKISQTKSYNNQFNLQTSPNEGPPIVNPKRIISKTTKNKYKQSAIRKLGSQGEESKNMLNDL